MNVKSLIGPVLGIVALLLFLLLPPIEPLTVMGMRAIGIFLFTIFWWATVSIGYPSLITIVLFVVTGVMKPQVAFASSWGHWTILWMMASMGLTEALKNTGFSRRFALWFVTRPFVAGRPWVLITMFLLACTAVGSVMAGAATCIVFVTIAEPMLEALGYKKGDRFAAMLIMATAWTASAALSTTPISHVMAIMMIDFIERDFNFSINFVQWMLFGIPMGLIVLAMLIAFFRFVVRPDVSRVSGMATGYLRDEAAKLGPIKTEEKLSLLVFLGVVFVWIFPGVARGILPGLSAYIGNMGYAIPPLVGVILLCMIRVKKKPLLSFKQWTTSGIGWGTIALVAAIQAIGKVISTPETGIAEFLTGIVQPIANTVPFWLLLMLTMLWVVVQTNLMSNLVSQTLVYTIMVPVAVAAGTGNPIALGVAISGACNYAFSLPSATTATAIAIGSGWVPVGFMAKYGFLMVIPIVLLFTFFGYYYAAFIFG